MAFGFLARVALCAAVVFSSYPAYAQDNGVIKLCDALADDKIYEGDNEDFKKIVAGKDGWLFRSDFDLRQSMDDFELSEWSVTSFGRLKKAFNRKGTDLAVVMLPTRGLVGYPNLLPPYDTSFDHAKAKMGYVTLLEGLKKSGLIVAGTYDVETVPGFFLKNDNHWTADGAKYAAQKIAEAVKASPVYAGLKKAEFETTEEAPAEAIDANDNFIEFIEETCKIKIDRVKISKIYKTVRKASGDTGEALLGADEKPEVTLLGTSQSTDPMPSYANFIGFLREALGVDVKNDSITGGSMRGAIGNYVLTGDYDAMKPKLIIWELSAHYGFEQRSFFREIIPAVYGACSDEEAIAKSEGAITGKETKIFEGLGPKAMYSYDYYLVLELSDKEQREVKVAFNHMGGKDDEMKFERSKRNFPTNNGLYFSELRYGINEPLESVSVKLKSGQGTYKAKMCKVPLQ